MHQSGGGIKWICDSKGTFALLRKQLGRTANNAPNPTTWIYSQSLWQSSSTSTDLSSPGGLRPIKTMNNSATASHHEPSSMSMQIALLLDTGRNQSRQFIEHFSTANATIRVGGERITGDFSETIRHLINGTYLCVYYCKAKGWKSLTYECIDW